MLSVVKLPDDEGPKPPPKLPGDIDKLPGLPGDTGKLPG
jgi:hypothetical protein